jgi:hypothetical protein
MGYVHIKESNKLAKNNCLEKVKMIHRWLQVICIFIEDFMYICVSESVAVIFWVLIITVSGVSINCLLQKEVICYLYVGEQRNLKWCEYEALNSSNYEEHYLLGCDTM